MFKQGLRLRTKENSNTLHQVPRAIAGSGLVLGGVKGHLRRLGHPDSKTIETTTSTSSRPCAKGQESPAKAPVKNPWRVKKKAWQTHTKTIKNFPTSITLRDLRRRGSGIPSQGSKMDKVSPSTSWNLGSESNAFTQNPPKIKSCPKSFVKTSKLPFTNPKEWEDLLVSLSFYDDFGIVQLLYVLMFLDLSSAQLPRRSVDSSAPSLRPWWFGIKRFQVESDNAKMMQT